MAHISKPKFWAVVSDDTIWGVGLSQSDALHDANSNGPINPEDHHTCDELETISEKIFDYVYENGFMAGADEIIRDEGGEIVGIE